MKRIIILMLITFSLNAGEFSDKVKKISPDQWGMMLENAVNVWGSDIEMIEYDREIQAESYLWFIDKMSVEGLIEDYVLFTSLELAMMVEDDFFNYDMDSLPIDWCLLQYLLEAQI